MQEPNEVQNAEPAESEAQQLWSSSRRQMNWNNRVQQLEAEAGKRQRPISARNSRPAQL